MTTIDIGGGGGPNMTFIIVLVFIVASAGYYYFVYMKKKKDEEETKKPKSGVTTTTPEKPANLAGLFSLFGKANDTMTNQAVAPDLTSIQQSVNEIKKQQQQPVVVDDGSIYPTCPTGYRLDGEIMCASTDPSKNDKIVPNCPYTYIMRSNRRCYPQPSTPMIPGTLLPTAGTGTTTSSLLQCQPGYNLVNGQCILPYQVNPTCPDGYKFLNEKCTSILGTACPDLYPTLVGYANICSNINTASNVCLTGYVPAGYNSNICVIPPPRDFTCPQNYTYSTSQGKCVYSAGQLDEVDPTCPSGYAFDGGKGSCFEVAAVGCNTGFTLDAKSNVCTNGLSNVCLGGYVLDTATNNCFRNMSSYPNMVNCPTGYSYNATRAKCTFGQALTSAQPPPATPPTATATAAAVPIKDDDFIVSQTYSGDFVISPIPDNVAYTNRILAPPGITRTGLVRIGGTQNVMIITGFTPGVNSTSIYGFFIDRNNVKLADTPYKSTVNINKLEFGTFKDTSVVAPSALAPQNSFVTYKTFLGNFTIIPDATRPPNTYKIFSSSFPSGGFDTTDFVFRVQNMYIFKPTPLDNGNTVYGYFMDVNKSAISAPYMSTVTVQSIEYGKLERAQIGDQITGFRVFTREQSVPIEPVVKPNVYVGKREGSNIKLGEKTLHVNKEITPQKWSDEGIRCNSDKEVAIQDSNIHCAYPMTCPNLPFDKFPSGKILDDKCTYESIEEYSTSEPIYGRTGGYFGDVVQLGNKTETFGGCPAGYTVQKTTRKTSDGKNVIECVTTTAPGMIDLSKMTLTDESKNYLVTHKIRITPELRINGERWKYARMGNTNDLFKKIDVRQEGDANIYAYGYFVNDKDERKPNVAAYDKAKTIEYVDFGLFVIGGDMAVSVNSFNINGFQIDNALGYALAPGGTDNSYWGADEEINNFTLAASDDECRTRCANDETCTTWTKRVDNNNCYIYKSKDNRYIRGSKVGVNNYLTTGILNKYTTFGDKPHPSNCITSCDQSIDCVAWVHKPTARECDLYKTTGQGVQYNMSHVYRRPNQLVLVTVDASKTTATGVSLDIKVSDWTPPLTKANITIQFKEGSSNWIDIAAPSDPSSNGELKVAINNLTINKTYTFRVKAKQGTVEKYSQEVSATTSASASASASAVASAASCATLGQSKSICIVRDKTTPNTITLRAKITTGTSDNPTFVGPLTTIYIIANGPGMTTDKLYTIPIPGFGEQDVLVENLLPNSDYSFYISSQPLDVNYYKFSSDRISEKTKPQPQVSYGGGYSQPVSFGVPGYTVDVNSGTFYNSSGQQVASGPGSAVAEAFWAAASGRR